jgi:hypothetical protein
MNLSTDPDHEGRCGDHIAHVGQRSDSYALFARRAVEVIIQSCSNCLNRQLLRGERKQHIARSEVHEQVLKLGTPIVGDGKFRPKAQRPTQARDKLSVCVPRLGCSSDRTCQALRAGQQIPIIGKASRGVDQRIVEAITEAAAHRAEKFNLVLLMY